MNESSSNPYSAPEADITPQSGSGAAFAEFPRFSAWWVFFLSIITLSVYYYYWLISRASMINRALPQRPMSIGLIWALIAIAVGNSIYSNYVQFVGGPDPEQLGLFMLTTSAVSLMTTVIYFVIVFAMRSRINELTGAPKGTSLWCNGILTFFFGPIYHAYKINQIKDAESGVG